MGKVVFVLLFCLFVCFFFCLCPIVCWWVYVFFSLFFMGGGVEVWAGLFFLKSPGQSISCFFRVTNLSAILLLYCDAFFASPWQWEPTGVSGFFLFQCWAFREWCPFPCFLIHLGFFPALYFIQHKYLLVPTVMAGQHLL